MVVNFNNIYTIYYKLSGKYRRFADLRRFDVRLVFGVEKSQFLEKEKELLL